MANNSFSYFFDVYQSTATGSFKVHYDFNKSGVNIVNTTGVSGFNANIFYKDFNQNLNNSSLWYNNTTTVVQNATIAPDGTNTAIKLIAQTNNGEHYLATSNVGSAQFSCYAKSSNEYSSLLLRPIAVVNNVAVFDAAAEFDIKAGTILSVDGNCAANITYINNGWYKCSMAYTGATYQINEFRVEINKFGGPGNNVSGIYFWGGQIESGVTGGIQGGNFWQNSGSGYFSGTYAHIQDTGNQINFCNSTYSLIYDKVSPDGGTLISTVCTGYDVYSGTYYKGFEFGVTANNYLYFEYYTNNGPQTFMSDIQLADKASVFLTLKPSNVNFGYYDYFYNRLNSVNYTLNSNYLFDATNLYIASNPNTGLYSYNKSFYGYMDEFCIFNPPIEQNDLIVLNSGYSSKYFTGNYYVEYYTGTGIITGYQNVFTGYYYSVTGYQNVVTGTVTDDFGNQYDGIQAVPLTGYVSGYTSVPLLQTGTFPIESGYTGNYAILDSGYVYSFGKNNINILSKINSDEIIDISIPDANYPYSFENNLNLQYDKINGNYFNNDLINTSNFIVFANGLAQSSGVYTQSGNIYSNADILYSDYIMKENSKVFFSLPFGANDNMISDIYTGTYDTGLYIKNFSLNGVGAVMVKNILPYGNSFDQWTLYNSKLLSRKNLLTYSNNFLTPNFGNLVTYSNSFDQWVPYSNTIRNLQKNATDPFGSTNNAWSFPISGCWNAPGSFHGAGLINPNYVSLKSILTNGSPIVISVWMKTDNPTGLSAYNTIAINDSCGGKDLTSSLTASWQRFYSYDTYNNASDAQMQFIFVPKTGTPGASVTGNIYLYGAQIEANFTVPGPYIENGATATTYANTTLPWTLTHATLYPGQNLLRYSNDFSNNPSVWGKNVYIGSMTTSTVTDPFGGNTATQFNCPSDGFGGFCQYQTNYGSFDIKGIPYAFSAYVKYVNGGGQFVFGRDGYYSEWDLNAGTKIGDVAGSSTSSSITSVGNGWYRVSSTWIENGIGNRAVILYARTANSTFQVYGAQLEANTTIPGTYIPTTSSVSTPVYNSQSDPFGGTGAVKLIEDTATGSHDLYIPSNYNSYGPGRYTYSAYLKSGENKYVNMYLTSREGVSAIAAFDLNNGSVSSSYYRTGNWDAPTARITGVGSGWYRCSVSANYGKNLMRSSNKFTDTTAWIFGSVGGYAGNTILSGNQISDPSGSTGASLLIRTGSASGQCVLASDYKIMPTQPSTTYTYSVYFTTGYKIGGSAALYFYGYNQNATNFNYLNNGTYSYLSFSLSSALTGTITNGANTGTIFANNNQVSRTCTPVGNGWYRHQFTFQTASSGYYLSTLLQLQSDGAQVASGAYVGIYGQQLELGPSATQYLDTATGAAYLSGIGVGLQMTKTSGAIYESYQGGGTSGIYVYGQQLSDNSQPCPYVATTGTVSATGYKFVSDPFGGTGAVKILETFDNLNHSIQLPYITTNSNSPYVFSVYLKSDENKYVSLTINDVAGNSTYVLFDIYSGIAYNAAPAAPYNDVLINQASGTIYSVGNGWYRCAISSFITNNRYGLGVSVFLQNSNSSSTPNAYLGTGGGLYMYGAQLETGILPGHYIDNTGTQLNYVYSLPWDPAQNNIFYNGQKLLTGTNASVQNGVASIGHTSYAYSTGKNLLLYSQEFNSSYWVKSSKTLFSDNLSDPFGGKNASKFSYTGATEGMALFNTPNIPIKPNTNYTFSIYIQPYSNTYNPSGYVGAAWWVNDPSNSFTFSDWVVSIPYNRDSGGVLQENRFLNGSFSNVAVGNNWYRQSLSFTSPSNAQTFYAEYALNGWVDSHLTSGTGAQLNFFGAQLEEGTGTTSYSRTSSTINTTRTNGVYFLSGSQPFSSSSGNLFALPRNFQTEITGKYNVYNLPKFYTDYSEVYKNGIRLQLAQDYLELAKYDINSGSGIFDSNSNLLYNNNDVF